MREMMVESYEKKEERERERSEQKRGKERETEGGQKSQRRVDAVATKVTAATVHRHARPSKQRDVKKASDRKRKRKRKNENEIKTDHRSQITE